MKELYTKILLIVFQKIVLNLDQMINLLPSLKMSEKKIENKDSKILIRQDPTILNRFQTFFF